MAQNLVTAKGHHDPYEICNCRKALLGLHQLPDVCFESEGPNDRPLIAMQRFHMDSYLRCFPG